MNDLSKVKNIIVKKPLKLDCGKEISNFPLAYETYGKLNENKDNAILVFHALTGDQFASGINPVTNKEGWWSHALGPGKALDTEKFFVICANVIGGCLGSYGPSTIDTKTNKPLGTNFPVITGIDYGHTDPLITIPIGSNCELNTLEKKIKFLSL